MSQAEPPPLGLGQVNAYVTVAAPDAIAGPPLLFGGHFESYPETGRRRFFYNGFHDAKGVNVGKPSIEVGINGGEPVPVSSARVYVEGVAHDEPDWVQVEFNFTDEGLISEVWDGDERTGTSSETYEEMAGRLLGKS